MCLQKLVDDRREVEQGARDGRAGNASLVGLADRHELRAGGYGPAGFASGRILDAALLAVFHHLAQFAQRVEAARKSDVGVKLHQDLLGLADAEARIQPLIQGGVQPGQVACRHAGGDQGNGLLPGRKRIGGGLRAVSGLRGRGVLRGAGRRRGHAQAQRERGGQRHGPERVCGRFIVHVSRAPSMVPKVAGHGAPGSAFLTER
ncbi:hypothetical protein D3C85_1151100 [compost metagenome]